MRKSHLLFTLAMAVSAMSLFAKVTPATIFSDHMVLQREMAVPVWGSANANEEIAVSFAGQNVTTRADKDGKWMVKLAPLVADATPNVLTIKGAAETITIQDVLVGEVWLCSGQSNMEMPIWSGNPIWQNIDGDKIAKQSANALIRCSRMPLYETAQLPRTDYPMTWAAIGPENAETFSATAYFFGKELQEKLGIPIGLVTSHWGGSRIEPWTPPCGFDSVPELASIAEAVNAKLPGNPVYNQFLQKTEKEYRDWLAAFRTAGIEHKELPLPPPFPEQLTPWAADNTSPTVIYNRMIYPFVPFAFRGAIWYQGESNLYDGMLYKNKMEALFNGWKEIFQNPDLKFYFVQIAPFRYGAQTKLPEFMEAQEAFARENEPQVGMIVINDWGNPDDIHPHHKEPVGLRLANLALNRDYGYTDIAADFPRPLEGHVEGNKYVISFEHVTKWQTKGNVSIDSLKAFEIAGIDGQFKPATVTIRGTDLILSNSKISKPYNMRYLWDETAEGKLINENGLPLGCFRFTVPVSEKDILGDLGNRKLAYVFDPLHDPCDQTTVTYSVDNSAELTGKVKQVTYYVDAIDNSGTHTWLVVSMDSFTDDVKKVGVPVLSANALFQSKVKNLTVFTNCPGIQSGSYPEGNVEFWPSNYMPGNALKLPGAREDAFDFDDGHNGLTAGYGSMQVHLFKEKQTLFAFNHFGQKQLSDFGIGNSSGANPDWTFSGNLQNFQSVKIAIYVTLGK